MAWQHWMRFAYLFGGNQRPMLARVARLAARLALPARFASAPLTRWASHAIRRRWFGRISRIVLEGRQLPLQLGDLAPLFFQLLALLLEMLIILRSLSLKSPDLTTETPVLASQRLPIRIRMAFRTRSSMRGSHRPPNI